MPNSPIGSPRVRNNRPPSDVSTPSAEPTTRRPDTAALPARTSSDGIDTDPATANLSNEPRAGRVKVSNLDQAPGLLNGSVVLPNSGIDHPAVRELQGALRTLSQRSGDESLDVLQSGSWDQETSAAVKAFQKNSGLQTDGIVGPRTAAALQRALKQGRTPNILLGHLAPTTPKAPSLDPSAVAKSAQMLVDKYGENYGVSDAWYNIDPNHALPPNVPLGGLKGAWKCNLYGGNAMRAAGFEPPYYGNGGQGGDPNANQFYKWSDKYAGKYGNKVHFKMVAEVGIEELSAEERKAKIIDVLKNIQPGDLIMVDHLGEGVADGGHTRVATSAFDRETETFEAGMASFAAAEVKTVGVGNFTGEETLWVIRPNRLAED